MEGFLLRKWGGWGSPFYIFDFLKYFSVWCVGWQLGRQMFLNLCCSTACSFPGTLLLTHINSQQDCVSWSRSTTAGDLGEFTCIIPEQVSPCAHAAAAHTTLKSRAAPPRLDTWGFSFSWIVKRLKTTVSPQSVCGPAGVIYTRLVNV